MVQTKDAEKKNMKGANKIVYIKTINVYIPPRTRIGYKRHTRFISCLWFHMLSAYRPKKNNTETQ